MAGSNSIKHSRKTPLADLLRPTKIEEIAGHEKWLHGDGLLAKIIASGNPLSLLFWGPPGCGKTTLARIYAQAFDATFIPFSAASGSLSDLKKMIEEKANTPLLHRRLILFIDEIHRLNKNQQDFFLPLAESGQIILIGATTENPSFALQGALLSRLRVIDLQHLRPDALESILARYEVTYGKLPLTQEAREFLLISASGDGRYLLNLVENLSFLDGDKLYNQEEIASIIQRRAALYDKQGEQHYNLISALHKAVRSSDADAALYWLARILSSGEEPLFVGRRLVRMASEDIGLADPTALGIALNACAAFERLGTPEGELALAQATLYLALSPKSNALYVATKKATALAEKTSHLPPRAHSVNAPTTLMKKLGYSAGYIYDHDTPEGCSGQNHLPEDLANSRFYEPVERGFEREMKKRLEYFLSLRD